MKERENQRQRDIEKTRGKRERERGLAKERE